MIRLVTRPYCHPPEFDRRVSRVLLEHKSPQVGIREDHPFRYSQKSAELFPLSPLKKQSPCCHITAPTSPLGLVEGESGYSNSSLLHGGSDRGDVSSYITISRWKFPNFQPLDSCVEIFEPLGLRFCGLTLRKMSDLKMLSPFKSQETDWYNIGAVLR